MKIQPARLSLALCLCLSTAAATVTFTGCAGNRYNRSTGEYIDDKSLNSQVKDALSDNTEYKFEGVLVTVFKGTVQLSGFVNTVDQKNKAGDIAKQVPGVQNVVNNISVKDKL